VRGGGGKKDWAGLLLFYVGGRGGGVPFNEVLRDGILALE
jgi:hypothetical protein